MPGPGLPNRKVAQHPLAFPGFLTVTLHRGNMGAMTPHAHHALAAETKAMAFSPAGFLVWGWLAIPLWLWCRAGARRGGDGRLATPATAAGALSLVEP